ncbi:MAG: hypothetical protein HC875_32905 [Anaerolineales bacterium]|nr:hypothetical protein [Anaerolineales bacterium]
MKKVISIDKQMVDLGFSIYRNKETIMQHRLGGAFFYLMYSDDFDADVDFSRVCCKDEEIFDFSVFKLFKVL